MRKYRTIDCIVLLSALVTCIGFRDAAAAAPPAYHVTDLGSLGGTESRGQGINASGQVAGLANITGDGFQHAFLWTPTSPNGVSGTMHDLGTLGGNVSYGYGINASGQMTGFSSTTGDVDGHAFLYDGSMHDLGTLGGTSSIGIGINASGQVAGTSSTIGDPNGHAILWTPTTPSGASGSMHDLGTLGGTYAQGNGINDSGRVTGASSTITGTTHAFLWTPTMPGGASGTMDDLGSLGGTYAQGNGINASGQVTGASNTTEGGEHAFLYDGTLHNLGTLGGTYSAGYGINTSGQVTGYARTTGDAADHAFLYSSGSGMVDLNTLIDPLSGWLLEVGNGINDAGQITGWGQFGDQPNRAFLLTPVPEPATLALAALGLPILVWRKLRRSVSGGVRVGRRFALTTTTRAAAVARSDQ